MPKHNPYDRRPADDRRGRIVATSDRAPIHRVLWGDEGQTRGTAIANDKGKTRSVDFEIERAGKRIVCIRAGAVEFRARPLNEACACASFRGRGV